ncbi:hypothetical protein CL689_02400 [Candidatus Saccharibacteria bacterium]|nr:hypothetical protein [Candidatus Saccharibacteria bacterium]
MRLTNEQAIQRVRDSILKDIGPEMLNMDAEIENDEFGTLRYSGNLLGYTLQANLAVESIALIAKYPEMCSGIAQFEGFCKVSGDTTTESIPLAILAIKTESYEAFQAFIGACELDLTLQAHQSELIDESFTQSRTAGIIEMCDWSQGRLDRLKTWGAKYGIEITQTLRKEPEDEELGDRDDEDESFETAPRAEFFDDIEQPKPSKGIEMKF